MAVTSFERAVQEEKESLQAEPDSMLDKKTPGPSPSAASGGHEHQSGEQLRALAIFKYLLVFVAALESFAHGANDTANATGLHGPYSPDFGPACELLQSTSPGCLCRCVQCCLGDLQQRPGVVQLRDDANLDHGCRRSICVSWGVFGWSSSD